MKRLLIRYRLREGAEESWRQEIARFVEALDSDPDVRGKISYRVIQVQGSSEYYHLVTAADDEAIKMLQSKEFFSHYTSQNKLVAENGTEVVPLEVIDETAFQA